MEVLVERSDLSLLGLVRHLSDAGRYWSRQVMAGEDAPARYRHSAGDDHDRAFSDAAADPAVALAWENWRAEVAFAERFVGEASDLGFTKPYVGRGGHQGQVSLRECWSTGSRSTPAISAMPTCCGSASTAGWGYDHARSRFRDGYHGA